MCRIVAVVPCHNRREKTVRFIQAFLKQVPDQVTDFKLGLVLVDAASQDGTIEAVRSDELQTQFRQRSIDFTLVQVPADYYWTATTNAGIKVALQQDADYILTINDDCIIEAHYVAILLHTAQQYQRPILGSRIDYLTEPGLIWALGMSTDWKKHLFAIQYRHQWFEQLPTEIQQAPWLAVEALAGDGVLIHRQVFETIGLYAEQMLPHYLADVEFTLRASRAGFPVAVCPSAIVYDDSPLPHTEPLPSGSKSLRHLWSELRFRYFHPRSGENLPAKLYVIREYCPNRLKPWAFLRRGIAICRWTLQQLRLIPRPGSSSQNYVSSTVKRTS